MFDETKVILNIFRTLAIEDGFIIGSLFSRISTKDQIVNILKGYNQIRKKRLEDVSDKKILFTFTLPPGPARDARNDAYRPTLYQADMDDEVLADLWNSYIRGLSYDPRDAVEEWWHFWGKHSLNS
ncbi:hypothetical protein D9758_010323 [Tetrapyrgos nigripes]|uniref:Uncharacterized protein n=1 Tax=Tetrapyrgos nigripes TaxID=182062 RepID=A0A8H5LKX0_9AGAR|nr:hypothetical protein D9758_010323 [Tetrapyrgos nigripes]